MVRTQGHPPRSAQPLPSRPATPSRPPFPIHRFAQTPLDPRTNAPGPGFPEYFIYFPMLRLLPAFFFTPNVPLPSAFAFFPRLSSFLSRLLLIIDAPCLPLTPPPSSSPLFLFSSSVPSIRFFFRDCFYCPLIIDAFRYPAPPAGSPRPLGSDRFILTV